MMAIVGGALMLASSFLFYLASPNRIIAVNLKRAGLLKITGAAGMAAALAVLLQSYGLATAIFVAATLAMLVLSLAPLAIAWWQGMPEERK